MRMYHFFIFTQKQNKLQAPGAIWCISARSRVWVLLLGVKKLVGVFLFCKLTTTFCKFVFF